MIIAAQCEADISRSSQADGRRSNGLTYKEAGVDIDAGNALVEAIKPLAKSTARTGANSALGGFGGLFDLNSCGFQDPVLVACNDGVGTKVLLAIETGHHSSIGIDLVAMCINDLVVQGAEPLFFLDYYATGKLSVADAIDVLTGIAHGCQEAGCALIGGETAEMPGLYGENEYDLAGFAVGAVERGSILPKNVAIGDAVIGLPSAGFHSNGYSLVRRVIELSGLSYEDPAPFESASKLSDVLLKPTRIYAQSCLALVRADLVHGFAHITGGGLIENLPRVLPDSLAISLNANAIPLPAMMEWTASVGNLSAKEMVRTFNCGIGMAVVVDSTVVDEAMTVLKENGEEPRVIGEVCNRGDSPPVLIKNLEQAWSLA
ncbi:MAG: phosphoribosylformylglycinamidine cyclo-ligase [Rhodospirillaceae bacterium]